MSPRTPPPRSISRSVSPPQFKKSSKHRRSTERRYSRSRSRSARSESGTPPHSAHGRRYSGYSSSRDHHGSSRSGYRKHRDSYSSGYHHDKYSSRRNESRHDKEYRDGRDHAEPCPCLGIFGMNHSTTEKDLMRIFKEFGHIKSVRIVNDRDSGRSRGFGFVYFSETHEAEKAKAEMGDAVIDGFRVRIDYSVTNHNPERFSRSSRRTPSPPRR